MKVSNTNKSQRSNDLSESQIKQLQNKIIEGRSYKLAYTDTELLSSDDLRPLIVETAKQTIEIMREFYNGQPPK